MATKKEDLVNHPNHYTNKQMECIDWIRYCLTPEEFKGFLQGNSLKYLYRWKEKGGVIDLQKAVWYTNKLAEVLEK